MGERLLPIAFQFRSHAEQVLNDGNEPEADLSGKILRARSISSIQIASRVMPRGSGETGHS